MVARKPHSLMSSPALPLHIPNGRPTSAESATTLSEDIKQLIQDLTADVHDLETFYCISVSRTRLLRLGEYIVTRMNELVTVYMGRFDELDPQGQVDFIMILQLVLRRRASLADEWTALDRLEPLLGGWSPGLIELCEKRQKVIRVEGKEAAQALSDARRKVEELSVSVAEGKLGPEVTISTAYRALQVFAELETCLEEWFSFYRGYDPVFTWWVRQPWEDLRPKLRELARVVSEKLVGVSIDDRDAIVGLPSGRESILADLQSEMIPYSPEELIEIGEREYQWCEKEMIKASKQLGYGSEWRKALEHVKTLYVEPGEQIYLVHELANEAVEYVTKHDMVTIPEIANETWRTFMLSPERQKVAPFFLGGESILVAAPKGSMSHEDKMMSLRGNNKAFSRSTVFHELLPGHHLQFYYMARSRPYRQAFRTPFWAEGWSFYWEMILWDRGFPGTPENKIGMLFWRMHRCARIIFSLKFHLGQMTPQQCVDFLVEKVGHERSTAEGEVRRSFNGDWTPLYQAGYMLGALQLYALRRELVDSGKLDEKTFHDRIMKNNCMPIELVRALLKGEKLTARHKAAWRFYPDL